MAKFNDGTWATLGAVALLGVAAVTKRGSRARALSHIVLAGHGRMPVFTADYVEQAEIETLGEEIGDAYDGFMYVPTESELRSLEWLGDRYSISTLLLASLRDIPMLPRTLGSAGKTMKAIVIPSSEVLKKAIWEDGGDRIPMLSDDLPLQRLVWLNAPDDQDAGMYAIEQALEERGRSGLLYEAWVSSNVRENLECSSGPFYGWDADQKAEWLIEAAAQAPPELQG